MWKILFFILLGVLCATIIFSGIYIMRLRYDLAECGVKRDEYRAVADGRYGINQQFTERLSAAREVETARRELISELRGENQELRDLLSTTGNYYPTVDGNLERLQEVLRELARRSQNGTD